MRHSDPRQNHTTQVHVHRRDWRPCPHLFPEPLRPTKPIAIFYFNFAAAIQHLETMMEFVAEHPVEFPRLAASA